MNTFAKITTLAALLATSVGFGVTTAVDEFSTWNKTGREVYETGFARRLQVEGKAGVKLFEHVLIENDAAGGGRSDRGPSASVVWGEWRARKLLTLDDPRAHGAELYVFPQAKLARALEVSINGHATRIEATPRKGNETIRWIQFPVEWLRAGENVIELSSPDAKSETEGWRLNVARADEYVTGGGDPAPVGKTSFHSRDGGKSWLAGCGLADGTAAEFSVRIGLKRQVTAGMLETPVIDLWKGDADTVIARQRAVRKFTVTAQGAMPAGTSLVYSLRKGSHPSPFAKGWEPYEKIGEGATLDAAMTGAVSSRRYVQLKVEFATANPLVSPSLAALGVRAEFREDFPIPSHQNLRVVELDNAPVWYSSLDWKWESPNRPEFAALRLQENLDEVVRGARTEFEAMVRLRDYAKKRWEWTHPAGDFPAWDALSIVERVSRGGGGMCIQQNLFLVGLCQAMGWQGRLVAIDSHEVAEIWSNDYGKWVYFDAYFPNHNLCDPETGVPLSMLEIHERYLEFFHPDGPIDWVKDARPDHATVDARADTPRLVSSSLDYANHENYRYTGFVESRMVRMVPRSNFIEQPLPRPLNHAAGGYYWNGYVSWYDGRTPIKGQYADYTDRARDLWPDLNTVHITASQGPGNDRVFLEFETYTPGFSHFEVLEDSGAWRKSADRWTWLLAPGKNSLQVRAVNEKGVGGKPARVVINRLLMPETGWKKPVNTRSK
ncbi:transglutaminase-like domain-containing protein [Oleiharenicola lentus]|uniref:transglutaminase-like domain-containing protein n=1 Tax=Oleiharenicola lentus TaxID=2508720 RepID=UPI003F67FBB3